MGAGLSILITGAAGFIGFHVARALLHRGEHVIGIDSLNDYYAPQLKRDRLALLAEESGERFRFLHLDFADRRALNETLSGTDFDRIVHLGAQAGVRHSIDHPHDYVHSNLVGHLNLLELARARGSSHLVYASSSSVYGGNERLPFSVDDRADHPVSLYAATKRADELMSESYAHLFRLPQTGLRFFTVYGPWGRPDMAIWIFTQRILAEEPIPVFNEGRTRRDFTYVEDIVSGVLASLDRPPPDDGQRKPGGSEAPHRLYNIGNNRSESLLRVIALIEGACGRKAQLEMLPMPPGDVPETFADIDPIRHDLSFQPRTTIDEGIPRFVKWYRDYLNLPG